MNKYNIDTEAHYFILMHPLEGFGPIVFTSNLTREKWVECQITESRYKIDNGYKVELMSLEEGYGKRSFYIEDFISLLNEGYIIKNDNNYECKEVHWIEPITDTVNVHHSAYTLVPKQKKK